METADTANIGYCKLAVYKIFSYLGNINQMLSRVIIVVENIYAYD